MTLRPGLVTGLAALIALALLGLWLMQSETVTRPTAATVPPAVVGKPRTEPQASAIAEAPVAPTSPKSATTLAPLRGRVIDAVTRKPIREFELQLFRPQPNQAEEEAPVARTFRSADGSFVWEHPPPGEWTLAATATGYQTFELNDLRLPVAEPAEDLVLLLHPGLRLRGRVYDEDSGAPIADVHIMAHRTRVLRESESRLFGTPTQADGTFVLEGLAPGRYGVSVVSEDYERKKIEVVVGDNTAPLEIGLFMGGTITGRLVASDGTTPVSGMVNLKDLDRHSGSGRSTSAVGKFELRGLAPGNYQLKGEAEAGMVTRAIVLGRNQRIDGVILVLSAGHSIRGKVTGLRPDRQEQLNISIVLDDDRGARSTRADQHGAFVIQGVPPGGVYIEAGDERRLVSKTVEMPADSDLTVNLDFPRGVRLSGRMTRGGEPLANVPVGPVPRDMQPAVYVGGTETSADGTYVIEDLPPGRYSLMVERHYTPPLEIAGDTVFDFDVPGGQISGRVLDARGNQPIAYAQLNVYPVEPDEMQQPEPYGSDAAGRFTVLGLEAGEYIVTAYKPGYEIVRKRITYETKLAELQIQLREERGVRVTARRVGSTVPIEHLFAIEVIGAGRGIRFRLQLDEEGTGYLPSALSGATLRFFSPGCEPTLIDRWNGDELDLELKRAGTQ